MKDLEIFARALENVLRTLIRFLVGKISLLKLSEMVRTIYIQEAERQLKIERPEKSVSLTRLAVLTGIDTRTLTKVRNDENYLRPVHKTKRFLIEMTPENCVLDLWSSDARFLDPKTGKPRLLKMSRGKNSFEQLISEAVSSRGVTAQSLLEKLISNKAIRLVDGTNEVELLGTFFGPFKSGDAISVLEVGLSHVASLMGTIFHNYDAIIDGEEAYYERAWFTHHLEPKNRTNLQKAISVFLKSAHEEAREILAQFEENYSSDRQLSAGVAMYYFEDASGSNFS